MSLRSRLSFIFWYLRRPPWDSGITPPELYDYIQNHPPGRALDLGCGTGTNVITLAQHGWQVTGVDFVPRAIAQARRKIEHAGIRAELRVGDVTRLDGLTGPFDLALDIGCFHSVENKTAYLDGLTRLLVPGGHWLMYGFFNPTPGHAGPGMTASDLERIQAHGFSILSRTDGFDRGERASAWFLFQRSK